eukprot:TRINITY_DN18668_c0_g1_i1.p2 TRINITY_DN18668_c0_g1~~TRINITY_DN18668_c0_g1_i1.p2  ORF type:complete len:160 (+),score=7.63 TRINITY_DN18668_c0_g1_i1:128-607(+)
MEKTGTTADPAKALVPDTIPIQEIKGDLFSCQDSDSLAHCVSVDLHMGKGIAVPFKQKFGGVDELKSQGKVIGECAVLQRGKRYVYYLITKQRYYHKPTLADLRRSLEQCRNHCISYGVKRLAMPRIGCGLDQLQWPQVKQTLAEVFDGTGIAIVVYSL